MRIYTYRIRGGWRIRNSRTIYARFRRGGKEFCRSAILQLINIPFSTRCESTNARSRLILYIYIFRIIDGSIMRNNVHSCNEKFRSLDNNNKVIRDNDNYARYRNYKLVSCEIIYIKDIIISRCEIFR